MPSDFDLMFWAFRKSLAEKQAKAIQARETLMGQMLPLYRHVYDATLAIVDADPSKVDLFIEWIPTMPADWIRPIVIAGIDDAVDQKPPRTEIDPAWIPDFLDPALLDMDA